MTDDQRDKLNRFLAEKVTQIYIPVGSDPRLLEEAWKDGDNIEWEPPNYMESWADCEPLLNKIEQDGWKWKMGTGLHGEMYWCNVMKNAKYNYYAQAESHTEALCFAIGKAYIYKEDDDASAK